MRERLKERQSQSKETVERIKIMNQEKNKEKEIMRNIIMEELEQERIKAQELLNKAKPGRQRLL